MRTGPAVQSGFTGRFARERDERTDRNLNIEALFCPLFECPQIRTRVSSTWPLGKAARCRAKEPKACGPSKKANAIATAKRDSSSGQTGSN